MKRVYTIIIIFLIMFSINVKAKSLSEMSSKEYVNELGSGWNMGSILSSSYEPSKELFSYIKKSGFNTVRFPISFTNYLDNDGNINKEFIDKLKVYVDYALKEDLYVSLDSYQDGIEPYYEIDLNSSSYNKNLSTMKQIWLELGKEFKDYNFHLMFGILNEPIDFNEGMVSITKTDSKAYEALNNFSTELINTIRSTGSNNKQRFIVVPTLGAKAYTYLANEFDVKDVKSHVIVGLNVYEYNKIETEVKSSIKILQDKGYGVVIRETAMPSGLDTKSINDNLVYAFTKFKEYNCSVWLWDDNLNMKYLDYSNNNYSWGSNDNTIKDINKLYTVSNNVVDVPITSSDRNVIILIVGVLLFIVGIYFYSREVGKKA